MSGTMRAARILAWKQGPVVEDVPVPVPGLEETLVRVEVAAVAHLDVKVASGDFGIKPTLPYVGGVEGCGVVVESQRFAPGTRVVLRGGGLGLVRDGTWAEQVVVKDKALTVLPEGLSPAVGATFWVPTTTAHTALHDVGRLGAWMDDAPTAVDEHVIVTGAAGAVGGMATQLAVRSGATVTALVADQSQVERVVEGVRVVVADDREAIEALTADRCASLLVDTLGGADLPNRARWVRAGGRAVSIGYVAGADVRIDLSNWLLDDVALLPVNMIRREHEARALIPELAAMLASGELTLAYETFALEDIGRALELLRTGGVQGRAVVRPG